MFDENEIELMVHCIVDRKKDVVSLLTHTSRESNPYKALMNELQKLNTIEDKLK